MPGKIPETRNDDIERALPGTYPQKRLACVQTVFIATTRARHIGAP